MSGLVNNGVNIPWSDGYTLKGRVIMITIVTVVIVLQEVHFSCSASYHESARLDLGVVPDQDLPLNFDLDVI